MTAEGWKSFLEADDATRDEAARVVGRLEAGESLGDVASGAGAGASRVLLALGLSALGDDGDEAGPSLTRSAPRRPRLARALSESSLSAITPGAGRPARLALLAGLRLIHDFWDESHEAAQKADDLGERSAAAYWHEIAHRREPDPGNAAYWVRRVGKHPAYGPLALAVSTILEAAPKGHELAGRLLPRGEWEPLGFVDLCGTADRAEAAIARRIQRAEMAILLEISSRAADVA